MTHEEFEANAETIHGIIEDWQRKQNNELAADAAGNVLVDICGGQYRHLPTNDKDLRFYIVGALKRQFAETRIKNKLREHGEDGYAQQNEALVAELKEGNDGQHIPTVTDPYEAVDLKLDVERALSKAKDQETAQAIRMIYLEGYSVREAAGYLGVDYRTLHSRIAATLKELRKYLSGYEHLFRQNV